MDESRIRALIREMMQQELAPILLASIVSNESNTRSTIKRFASDSPIQKVRNIQPFGVSSKAPVGTQAFIVPVNSDPTHLNMNGNFDEQKPDTADGETILYDAFGHRIYLSQSGLQFGSKSSANPMVLGDILQQFCDAICNALLQSPQVGFCAVGPVYLDPDIRSQVAQAQQDFVDDASTNFLSQKAFTER